LLIPAEYAAGVGIMSKVKGSGLKEQVHWHSFLYPFIAVMTNRSAGPSQDLKSLDVAKLTPLSPEVISRQATINIGAACAQPSLCVPVL
jgi:hypothetical protein